MMIYRINSKCHSPELSHYLLQQTYINWDYAIINMWHLKIASVNLSLTFNLNATPSPAPHRKALLTKPKENESMRI